MLHSQHLVLTRHFWLENVSFIWKQFTEAAEDWAHYNISHACETATAQLCSLVPQKHGLETRFPRISISNHCAHPDGRFYHRTPRLRLLRRSFPPALFECSKIPATQQSHQSHRLLLPGSHPISGPSRPSANAELSNQPAPSARDPRPGTQA